MAPWLWGSSVVQHMPRTHKALVWLPSITDDGDDDDDGEDDINNTIMISFSFLLTI